MKLEHVSIFTNCLEESAAFYEKMAGLSIQRDMREFGAPVVFMAAQPGDTCVELVGGHGESYHGGGIVLGFGVEDVEKEYQEKQAAGLNPGPMISPNPHARFFTVKDPNGVEVQFVQED